MRILRLLISHFKNITFLFFALICTFSLAAQSDLFPLQQDYMEEARDKYSSLDSVKHVGVLPFDIKNTSLERKFFYADSVLYYSVAKAKLLKDNLIEVDEPDFKLRVNPLFDINLGKDIRDTSEYADTTRFFQNSRGFSVDGKIGKRLFFHTSFLENQSIISGWKKSIADSLQIIPGSGRHKAYKDNGFDYGISYGHLSYYAHENLNLYFGHGKMFSGYGYRSFNLSHQTFNFPHLKITSLLLEGKLQVMWSMAGLQTLLRQPLGEVPESLFKKKSATFSSINYLLGKRFSIGVFESNIWRRYDEEKGTQVLPVQSYIPVPLVGYLMQNDSTQHRSRLGFNLLAKLTNNGQVYGQYQIERNAIQVGLRWNNLGIKGLRVQAEFNAAEVSPIADSTIDFEHFRQDIGHPVKEDFEELFFRIMYRHKRWNGSVNYTMINGASDRGTLTLLAGFLVNPSTNFNINVGYENRSQNSVVQYESGAWHFGVRTSVVDTLFDF